MGKKTLLCDNTKDARKAFEELQVIKDKMSCLYKQQTQVAKDYRKALVKIANKIKPLVVELLNRNGLIYDKLEVSIDRNKSSIFFFMYYKDINNRHNFRRIDILNVFDIDERFLNIDNLDFKTIQDRYNTHYEIELKSLGQQLLSAI